MKVAQGSLGDFRTPNQMNGGVNGLGLKTSEVTNRPVKGGNLRGAPSAATVDGVAVVTGECNEGLLALGLHGLR